MTSSMWFAVGILIGIAFGMVMTLIIIVEVSRSDDDGD